MEKKELKIWLLTEAQDLIQEGKEEFVCSALSSVLRNLKEVDNDMNRAATELRALIMNYIHPQSTYLIWYSLTTNVPFSDCCKKASELRIKWIDELIEIVANEED